MRHPVINKRTTIGVALLAIMTALLVGLGIKSASAHTPSLVANCDGITVTATNYEKKDQNAIMIMIDDSYVTYPFEKNGSETRIIPNDGLPHEWSAAVTTSNKNPKFSKSWDRQWMTCGEVEPPPVCEDPELEWPDCTPPPPPVCEDPELVYPDCEPVTPPTCEEDPTQAGCEEPPPVTCEDDPTLPGCGEEPPVVEEPPVTVDEPICPKVDKKKNVSPECGGNNESPNKVPKNPPHAETVVDCNGTWLVTTTGPNETFWDKISDETSEDVTGKVCAKEEGM